MLMDLEVLFLEVFKSSPNRKNTIRSWEPKILIPALNAEDTRKVIPNKIVCRIGEKVRTIPRVILKEIKDLDQGMDA